MSLELWCAMLVAAIGTYLMRVLPLLWMQRRLKQAGRDNQLDAMPKWLVILGPMMIAAVLGVSLIPRTPDTIGWAATVLGLTMTLLIWKRTRTLGLPVILGVITFGSVVVLLRHWM